MGLLKNLVNGMSEDKKILKARLKDAEQEVRIQKMVEERQKSPHRRELERYMKDKEEEKITEALKKIRKEKSGEMLLSKDNILKADCNLLKSEKNILNDKNIFKNQKKIFKNKDRMFMK